MRHFRTGSSSVIVIAVGLICIAPANAGPKRQQQEQPFRPVRLVKSELSALGQRNEPITDLRSGECQVSEDGKHQVIALFHYDGNRQQKTAPAGPEEFSNRDSSIAHPTVILLDLLSERVLTWGQAGEELVKSLQSVQSGESLYLYVLTSQGTFEPVHPLPRTEAELRAASTSWTQQIRPLFDVVSHDLAGFRPVDDREPWLRSQLTVRALGSFASSLSEIPGRKNLVWITHGIPTVVPGLSTDQPIDIRPQLKQLGESFVQANVAVYTVAQSASGAGESMGYSWETLQLISSLTGGRSYSSDSIGSAITDAMADAQGSYIVGYYPSREKDDSKFHKVRITCARKGLRLLTKAGYWAFPVQSNAQREQTALEAAAASPFDNPGIGLRVALLPLKQTLTTARIQIHVDSADLPSPDLAIKLVAYSANGTVQRAGTTPFPPNQEQAAKDIEVSGTLAIDNATQNIRVIIFDRNSNLTGSVTIPLSKDDSRKQPEH
jgi:VWFA-related protein